MLVAFTAAAALALALQAGPGDAAEARFRATLAERPGDIDARVGLAMALLRRGAWQEALPLLQEIEPQAGENADLFHALAIAYRRSGDDQRALQYYERARALSPADTDVTSGFENTVRAYGHSITVEGFAEQQAASGDAASGMVSAAVRLTPRVHLESKVRLQDRAATRDMLAGGGVRWRAGRASNVAVAALAGPGNTTLATADISATIINYAGAFEWGLGLRALAFATADVIAPSSAFAWDTGRWRFDARYAYSWTRFPASAQSAGDHSILLRPAWRASRRVALLASYAYGIESFEKFTADRVGSFGSTTLGAGLRLAMPSLSELHASWEHQWRSNDSHTTIDRFTLAVARFLP